MKKTNATDPRPSGLTRRGQLQALFPILAGAALVGSFGSGFAARAGTPAAADATAALKALEGREGGRLGVAILDTANGAAYGHRADELFALCSTFKFVLAAAILQRMDAGAVSLDRAITIPKKVIIPNSPVTEEAAGTTMTIGELCHATVTTSDNAAANLLLTELGGPQFVTEFLQALGDSVTRLDRFEPHMNNADVAQGDTRDTTSPNAMATTMQAIMLGDVLTPASRDILTRWMRATVTGQDRLRLGLPKDWILGHKTGTGNDGPTNDIGIAWPPGRPPVVIAVYYDRKGHTMKQNATILAEVGRIVARTI